MLNDNENMINTGINKPISLQIRELKTKITNCVNESSIHPTILLLVLKDIYNSIHNEVIIIEQKELQNYNNSSKMEESDE